MVSIANPSNPINANWVLAGTILPSSMAFIASSALNITLPALQADLGASGSDILWIINAYTLMLSALILIGGSLGDRFGRKRIFMIGIAVFVLTSALCGLTTEVSVLISLRLLQGIGGAMMVPGSLAILSAVFPPEQRGQAIGTWSTFSAITTLFGAPLGGFLASVGLWRVVFFINVPLGIIALYILWRYVPESRDEQASGQLDYIGAMLITLGLAGVTYGFTEIANLGLTQPVILLALVGGAACLAGFVFVELRSEHPLVQLNLFRNRTFSGANLMTLFVYATLGVFSVFFPLNLIQVQGYSDTVAGLAMLPFGITLAVMGRWAGGLVDRIGARIPLTIGPLITGAGYLFLAGNGLTGGSPDYFSTFFPAILIMSIGMGITVAPLTTTVMKAVPRDAVGTASGVNNAVSRVAGVLALATFGALILTLFSTSLMAATESIDLSDAARQALRAEATELAAARAPEGLDAGTTLAVETAIQRAFVNAFQTVMIIMAGLCWLGAIIAFFTIESAQSEDVVERDHVVAQHGSSSECTATVHSKSTSPSVQVP